MLTQAALIELTHWLSRRAWAWVISLSFVLALGSGLVLAVSAGFQLPQPLDDWYRSSELFVRDTIRLTFKTPHTGKPGQRRSQSDEVVFMAPLGILDEKRNFVFPEQAAEAELAKMLTGEVVRKSVAPPSLLDPAWETEFKGD